MSSARHARICGDRMKPGGKPSRSISFLSCARHSRRSVASSDRRSGKAGGIAVAAARRSHRHRVGTRSGSVCCARAHVPLTLTILFARARHGQKKTPAEEPPGFGVFVSALASGHPPGRSDLPWVSGGIRGARLSCRLYVTSYFVSKPLSLSSAFSQTNNVLW